MTAGGLPQSAVQTLREHGFRGRGLADLLTRCGTPLVVYDLSRIAENVQRVEAGLTGHFGAKADPAFALKSCYLPAVLARVLEAGWSVEVMSGFELSLALTAGVPGDRIIVTGLGWGVAVCRRALSSGVRRFVVDTREDLAALTTAAAVESGTAEVFVRVNLGAELPGTFLPAAGRHGFAPGAAFEEMVAAVAGDSRLEFAGLHFHQFNRLTDLALYEEGLRRFTDLAAEYQGRTGLHALDLGGGFECLSRLDRLTAPVETFVAAAAARLTGVPGLRRVTFEFGRAIAGDAAITVGTVLAVKPVGDVCWVVVDVPSNTLIPIPGAVYPAIPLTSPGSRPIVRCAYADGTGSPVAFCEGAEQPRPRAGDLVAFAEAGAYTTVFSELWAAELPTIALLSPEGGVRLRPGGPVSRRTWSAWYGERAWSDDQDDQDDHT